MTGPKVKGLESFIILVLGFLSIFFFIGSVKATTFCVSDADELQDALTTAASNGEDDIVQIVQGTHVGNFIYSLLEAFNLDVKGGYIADCASRVVDASKQNAVKGRFDSIFVPCYDEDGNIISCTGTGQDGVSALLEGEKLWQLL